MKTKATDVAFVYDSIHRAFRVNKAKVWVMFAEKVGWSITTSRLFGTDMEIEYSGIMNGEEEEDLIPDYAGDLEALRDYIELGRLIIGPEYAFFEERNRLTGWAVYNKWQHVAIDYIDRVGNKSALCISQDINIAIMLGYMAVKRINVDLETLR